MQKTEQQLIYWLGLIIRRLIWVSNFILIKKVLISISPIKVSGLRMKVQMETISIFYQKDGFSINSMNKEGFSLFKERTCYLL